MTGSLYLVATPIGNLGDLSPRAKETLNSADFIAAEDTRVSLKLLTHFDIKKPLISYHEHNRKESGEKILQRLLSGENCALVTDAGFPGISDPGEELVRMCAETGVPVIAVPGPCAAVTALAVSALPAGRFTFEGFLSTSRKSRFEHLTELKDEKRTMIFYEAPHKLLRTLTDLLAAFGERKISISREMTKLYEETLRFTLSDAIEHFGKNPPRGEFVLVVEGKMCAQDSQISLDEAAEAVQRAIDLGVSKRDAVKQVAEETGVSKNLLYSTVIGNN